MKSIEKILTLLFMIELIGPMPTTSEPCGLIKVWMGLSYRPMRAQYDKKQGKCTLMIGSVCNYRDCPTNAYCLLDDRYNDPVYGYCKCNEGYTKGESEVVCGKIVNHGESCQNEVLGGDALICDINSGLTCQNGTCQCLSPETTVSNNTCKPLVGEKCYTESMKSELLCQSRAYCARRTSKQLSAKCECQNGYVATDDGKCGGSAGTKCNDADNPCVKSLVCLEGQCVCGYPLNQIFDDQKKECLSLVGANCGGFNCTEFSECSTDSSKCTCKDGYLETPEGTCFPNMTGHGEPSQSGACKADKGLICIKGKCQCVDPHVKYLDGVGCVASKGMKCGWLTPPSWKKCNKEGKDCKSYFIGCEEETNCLYQPKGFWLCT